LNALLSCDDIQAAVLFVFQGAEKKRKRILGVFCFFGPNQSSSVKQMHIYAPESAVEHFHSVGELKAVESESCGR
jgi:hypothetical protein